MGRKRKKTKGTAPPSAPVSHDCIPHVAINDDSSHQHEDGSIFGVSPPCQHYMRGNTCVKQNCTASTHGKHTVCTLPLVATDVGTSRFHKLDERFACLHHYLDSIAEPAEILVSLNTPFRRHPIDDRHGNARYQTISHPNWTQIAPLTSIAIQSRTAIFLNKRSSAFYDLTVYPDVPDVDILYVALTEKPEYSRACHDCRTTVIELCLGDMYNHVQYSSHSLVDKHEVCSVNECEHIGFNEPAIDETPIEASTQTAPQNSTTLLAETTATTLPSPPSELPEVGIKTSPLTNYIHKYMLKDEIETVEDWLDELFSFSITPPIVISVDIWESLGLEWEPLPPLPCYPPASVTIEVIEPLVLPTGEHPVYDNNIDASGLVTNTFMGTQKSPFHCRRVQRIRRRPQTFGDPLAELVSNTPGAAYLVWSFGGVPWDVH
ncbi:hypothetical protein F5887DRAFT_1284364 [Amanita rubescens]|nr:hypothetical protein F5887DRAFT_1284364 [Amanita rubescens]